MTDWNYRDRVLLRLRTGAGWRGFAFALAAISLPGTAVAQEVGNETPPADIPVEEDTGPIVETDGPLAPDMIVVTGTLVRGVAPPGANVLAVSQEEIQATGANTVAQLLQTIPQLGSFNTLQAPAAVSGEVAVNRPNLRSLPGFNNAGGSTTLVLLDGHRLVGMGVSTTSPDPDIIPPGVIERVEIVPDGGSAIYGSDAVAGVINFVTIDRFDGVKASAHFGAAEDYHSWDINLTAGQAWDSGSVYASYNYAENDLVLGRDREYIRQFPNAAGFTELRCSPGNIEAGGGIFGMNGGPVTQCDASDFTSIYPAMHRHSVFAGVTQQLAESVELEVRGFYTTRETTLRSGPYRTVQRIATVPGIPGQITSPFTTPENTFAPLQQIDFAFGPNDAAGAEITLDTWGITPTLTADLDGNFQLRLLGSYGESEVEFRSDILSETALRNSINAGLFNPYSQSAASPDVYDTITNFRSYSLGKQNMWDFRAVIDGDLLTLPAGAVKIAAGVEYIEEEFEAFTGQAVPGFELTGAPAVSIDGTLIRPAVAPVNNFNPSRDVKSVFGELVVPVISNDRGMELTVSAAGRYDDYSDFGDTFNPRFGVTFDPIEWLTLRGAWGKSFNAPSLADGEDASLTTTFVLPGFVAGGFAPPADLQESNGGPFPDYNGGAIVAVRGNAPDIQPQDAVTWSAGFEVEPPFIQGLIVGASYYNIEFDNFIGLPTFENPAVLYRDFSNVITFSPSQDMIDTAIANADIVQGLPSIDASQVYAFFDARKDNLGSVKVSGIDFNANYRNETDFGAVFFNTFGTYELERKRSPQAGADFVDLLEANTSALRVRSTLGAEVGAILGQITWNHTQGYDLDPAVGFVPQTEVDDFNTFDLYFRWEVPGAAFAENLAFSLNVLNVFDQAPPEFRGPQSTADKFGIPATAQTLGRFVQIGVEKSF